MPLVTELELARHLKRDRKAVRLAAQSGRLTTRADGLFDLDVAVREWAETTHHEKGHNNRSLAEIPSPDIPLRPETKSTDYAKARAGTQIYEALLKKLRYEERAKNLTPTADVETARFTEFRILREACFNIPARIAALIAGETQVERCQQLLESELNSVFNAFADGRLS
ncbi:MAG TPA: hypothetical protein VE030_11205 [Burkholderiales bacterium]|nr:hypothetical protein [Burkholderiales bacterium]